MESRIFYENGNAISIYKKRCGIRQLCELDFCASIELRYFTF